MRIILATSLFRWVVTVPKTFLLLGVEQWRSYCPSVSTWSSFFYRSLERIIDLLEALAMPVSRNIRSSKWNLAVLLCCCQDPIIQRMHLTIGMNKQRSPCKCK